MLRITVHSKWSKVSISRYIPRTHGRRREDDYPDLHFAFRSVWVFGFGLYWLYTFTHHSTEQSTPLCTQCRMLGYLNAMWHVHSTCILTAETRFILNSAFNSAFIFANGHCASVGLPSVVTTSYMKDRLVAARCGKPLPAWCA